MKVTKSPSLGCLQSTDQSTLESPKTPPILPSPLVRMATPSSQVRPFPEQVAINLLPVLPSPNTKRAALQSPFRIAAQASLLFGLASLYLSPTADAIVTVGASGANGNNQSEASLLSVHSDFNYWDNIVNLGVGSGIYLGGNGSGAGYVLTANHLLNLTPGSSSISIRTT